MAVQAVPVPDSNHVRCEFNIHLEWNNAFGRWTGNTTQSEGPASTIVLGQYGLYLCPDPTGRAKNVLVEADQSSTGSYRQTWSHLLLRLRFLL